MLVDNYVVQGNLTDDASADVRRAVGPNGIVAVPQRASQEELVIWLAVHNSRCCDGGAGGEGGGEGGGKESRNGTHTTYVHIYIKIYICIYTFIYIYTFIFIMHMRLCGMWVCECG